MSSAAAPVDLAFSCTPDGWFVEPTACALPFDHCTEARVLCVGGAWQLIHNSNPPPPCPVERPAPGATCDRCWVCGQADCGYWCDDGVTWTIATCSSTTWELDGACDGA